jgi:hypothetical protein
MRVGAGRRPIAPAHPARTPDRGRPSSPDGPRRPTPPRSTTTSPTRRRCRPAAQSTTTYDLAGATKQAGEPSPGALATGHTAWFKWTPTATGGTSITTCADATDYEVIEVYTGTTLANLTPVVETGVTGCKPADIRFMAQAGTTYWIQADYDVYSPGRRTPARSAWTSALRCPRPRSSTGPT